MQASGLSGQMFDRNEAMKMAGGMGGSGSDDDDDDGTLYARPAGVPWSSLAASICMPGLLPFLTGMAGFVQMRVMPEQHLAANHRQGLWPARLRRCRRLCPTQQRSALPQLLHSCILSCAYASFPEWARLPCILCTLPVVHSASTCFGLPRHNLQLSRQTSHEHHIFQRMQVAYDKAREVSGAALSSAEPLLQKAKEGLSFAFQKASDLVSSFTKPKEDAKTEL